MNRSLSSALRVVMIAFVLVKGNSSQEQGNVGETRQNLSRLLISDMADSKSFSTEDAKTLRLDLGKGPTNGFGAAFRR